MSLELQLRAGEIGYQGILGFITSTQKTDSSYNTKLSRLFHPVISTNNTEILVEMRTGGYGEGVQHAIRNSFQRVHV